MILFAVFLFSFSSLCVEVLFVRIFSISQWNHLSFMVLSLVMFGFGASGTFLSFADIYKKGWENRLASLNSLKTCALCYCFCTLLSFIILNRLPLDYFRLPLEPAQTFYLFTAYVMLTLPFFITGIIIALAYAKNPDKSGLIYCVNMGGSAFGALVPLLFLGNIGESGLMVLAGLTPGILLFLYERKPGTRVKAFWILAAFLLLIIPVFLFSGSGTGHIRINPSPYKAISQLMQFPDFQVLQSVSSIRGKMDHVQSPYIRFAPGISLKYAKPLPRQTAVYKDGDAPLVLYDLTPGTSPEFARFTLSYAGYEYGQRPENVLIIQRSGGLAIACALASRAREITVLTDNKYTADRIRRHYNLETLNENSRAFLAQTGRLFSIIHVENWGFSLPGAGALSQEYDFTIEAFTQYLNHLTPSGLLIISRKLILPPSDSVRMFATALASLRRIRIRHPENHIALLRNWDTYTMIVSVKPINSALLKKSADNMNFDLIRVPEMTENEANKFNIFDRPFHFLEINRFCNAYLAGTENSYFDDSLQDLQPQTDNRPFPNRFTKWTSIKSLYEILGQRFYTLFMSGEMVVAAVFIIALVVSVILLLFPFIIISRDSVRFLPVPALYFLSIGAGFMCVEIFFIKSLILLTGDPVISFIMVLCAVLIFSGAGGLLSQNMKEKHLKYGLAGLVVSLLLIFSGMDFLIHNMLKLSPVLRCICSFAILLVPGILMGTAFPLGMRHLLKTPFDRTYAWAANGCSSVLFSVICTQIALGWGISAVMVLGIGSYTAAFLYYMRIKI